MTLQIKPLEDAKKERLKNIIYKISGTHQLNFKASSQEVLPKINIFKIKSVKVKKDYDRKQD